MKTLTNIPNSFDIRLATANDTEAVERLIRSVRVGARSDKTIRRRKRAAVAKLAALKAAAKPKVKRKAPAKPRAKKATAS